MSVTHTTLLPHHAKPVHWHSIGELARFYGRTERRIRQWCSEGRFAAMGIPVFRDARGRWWILVSMEE